MLLTKAKVKLFNCFLSRSFCKLAATETKKKTSSQTTTDTVLSGIIQRGMQCERKLHVCLTVQNFSSHLL